jgi:alpha-2-macroglobulin-like protein
MKRLFLIGLPCIALALLSFKFIDDDFIVQFRQQFTKLFNTMPTERIYVHTDKPFYQPGESIWLQAYLRNTIDMKASKTSDVLYVDLINPKGAKEQSLKLLVRDGVVSGDFQLSEEAVGGLYTIKAYTTYQKNYLQDADFFTKKIQVQEVSLPNLRMHLDFDKKAYGKGDLVSAALQLDALDNTPLSNQQFQYQVKLDGDVTQTLSGTTDAKGKAQLKFNLPTQLTTTDGLVNVMLTYKDNPEAISRSIPIVLNSIQMAFFPEGGEMVEGFESNMAFTAKNEFDKPADVEGYIINSKKERIANFNSYHFGMGAFKYTPQANETYQAIITKPAGLTEPYN